MSSELSAPIVKITLPSMVVVSEKEPAVEEVVAPMPQRPTQELLDEMNQPVFKQQDDAEEPTVEAPQQETPKPSFKFDDTNPAIYGEDLDVPAFIRRQQD